jgi:hypothetical protein
VIVVGEFCTYISVGFMSIATLLSLCIYSVRCLLYKMVECVFGSHISSGNTDRRLKFLQ